MAKVIKNLTMKRLNQSSNGEMWLHFFSANYMRSSLKRSLISKDARQN